MSRAARDGTRPPSVRDATEADLSAIRAPSDVREAAGSCVLEVPRAGGADVTLVSFAGHAGGFGGIATFEFARSVEDLPADKVFLRDPHDAWYLSGVPGAGGDPRAVAAWLRERCDRRGARRVVTVGNSAGGWAAILVGVLMKADEVHAFVPKTRISEPEDFRDQEKFRRVPEGGSLDPALRDARELMLGGGASPTRVYLHYPRHEPIDSRHALRMRGVPGVRLVEYRYAHHGLVREIRRLGLLRPILANAVAGNRAGLLLTVARARLLLRGKTRQDALLRPLWRAVTTPTR